MIPKIPVDISIPDVVSGISLIFALLIGCLFIYLACSCVKRLRPWRSRLYALLALLTAGGAIIILLIALNIHNYQRLTYEAEVAKIQFTRLGSQLYVAELNLAGKDDGRQFELYGDEWQIDARIIKWQAPLTLVGFDSIYRLERLQGRYHDITRERDAPRSVYALSRDSSLDIWSILRQHRRWLPWLDAFYGTATYLPMADGSRFEIRMTQSGLIARPLNDAARTAIGRWDR